MEDHKLHQRLVGAGVLPICYSTGRILLCKRGKHQSNGLKWASWGGGFEPDQDQTPKDCAKREFWEETRCNETYYITNEPIYIKNNLRFKYYLYAGMFKNEWIPDIESEHEAEDYGWFYLNDLPEDMIEDLAEYLNKNSRIINNLIKKFQDF